MISLLNYYGWKKFSIIHEEVWTTVAKSLQEQAMSKNMTINHCKTVIDNHKCCENNLACCRSSYWHQVSVSHLRLIDTDNIIITIIARKKNLKEKKNANQKHVCEKNGKNTIVKISNTKKAGTKRNRWQECQRGETETCFGPLISNQLAYN